MFPSKTHYKLREGFDLLGPRLCGDEWTGGEATANYPELDDGTIRTLRSYLANPESGGNVTDADKASPNVSEPAAAGKAEQAAARARQQSLEHQAAQARQSAGQERAAAQRGAIEQRRKGRLLSSRALALAAASGAWAGDPTVENILADIGAEGEFRALTELFVGEERARNLEMQADLKIFEGDIPVRGALRDAAGLIENGHPLSQEQHVLIAGFGDYIKKQAKFAELHNRQTKVETEIIQAAGAGEIPLEVFDAKVGSLTAIPAQTCLAEGFYLDVARNTARSPSQCWPDDGVVAIRRVEFDNFLAALDSDAKAASDRLDPSSSRAGRKPLYDRTDFMVELVRVVHDEGLPQAQAELEAKMLQWCQANWPEEPSVAWIRPRVSKVYKAIQGSRS